MTFGRQAPRVGVLFLVSVMLFSFSCRKPAPPQPPAPPPAPAPPPPAPVITLNATPATVERGQAVTLEWSAQNAGTVRIDPGIGDVQVSGNRQVNPASSVTYTATATGPGGTATDTARVTVNAPAPPPPAPAPPPAPTATIEDLFRDNVQDVLFDYDKSDIRPDQIGRLQSTAGFLRNNPNVRLLIEGHADERGNQEYNLGLGDQRANSVKQFLVQQGITDSRMTTISYGEERPQCSEQTEDCYQRNRRAAFKMQ